MKSVAVLLLACVSSVSAAPAVVWKSGASSLPVVHSADDVEATDLLSNLFADTNDFELPSVVFLVGRSQDGRDGLSKLSASGALPSVAAKYDEAACIHHHVSGVESPAAVVRKASVGDGFQALQISLGEFASKLTSLNEPVQEIQISGDGLMSKAVKTAGKRARMINSSNIFIVSIDADTDPAAIDSAVVEAIEHESVGSVVLSAVRSTAEVKRDRMLLSNRRLERMTVVSSSARTSSGRRLEDQGNDDGNNNNDDDVSGIYYVSFTPNIFAGLLFFLLFIFVTITGLSCMNMIAIQDVYITKMPPIGREA